MKRVDIVKRGFRNLRRNKSRSVLTILALSIGAISLTLTLGLGNALQKSVDMRLEESTDLILQVILSVDDETEDVGVSKYDPDKKIVTAGGDGPHSPDGNFSVQLMTKDEIDLFGDINGTIRVWPQYDVLIDYVQLAGSEDQYIVDSVDEQSFAEEEVLAGMYPIEWQETDIVLSETYLDSFGMTAESIIGEEVVVGFFDAELNVIEQTFTVAGILETPAGFGPRPASSNTGTITLSIDSLSSIYEIQYLDTADYNQFTSASVLLESVDVEIAVRDSITALNENYSPTSVSDFTEMITEMINTITLALMGFSAIALLAAGFGIVNTQLMSVFERTKEIGLLKALGMPNKNVRNLFSYEAIIIGIIGAVVGALIAFGFQEFVNNVFKEQLDNIGFTNGVVALTIQDVLMVVVGLGILSWLAGVIPARKAQRLDPIQALREE